MPKKITKGETHGCIVCGNLHQMLVVYDPQGKFIDAKVMSAGGRLVEHPTRPLVACMRHTKDEVEGAVERVYGAQTDEE